MLKPPRDKFWQVIIIGHNNLYQCLVTFKTLNEVHENQRERHGKSQRRNYSLTMNTLICKAIYIC